MAPVLLPEEHLRAGDLQAALAALTAQIRKDAANVKLRIFLFQLLCVLGDWRRAITQLKLCGEMAPEAIPMAQTYREAIVCEVFRDKVFAGEKSPLFFGEPQEWLARLAESVRLLALGRGDEAARLRELAFDAAPASPGMLDGTAFEWVADADSRLGPVIEAIINGKYFWLPFAAVARLDLEAPADLRDQVWMPAHLTLHNGGQVVALLPARYAGTAEAGTDAERLGRATSWSDAGNDTWIGRGQRLWVTEGGEVALLDVRALTVTPPEGAEGAAGGDAAGDRTPQDGAASPDA